MYVCTYTYTYTYIYVYIYRERERATPYKSHSLSNRPFFMEGQYSFSPIFFLCASSLEGLKEQPVIVINNNKNKFYLNRFQSY